MATWKTRWNPTEAREQKAFVRWFTLQYADDILFSIPNHLIRSPAQAMNEFALGLRKGMPDLGILRPCGPYHGLFVEMKRSTGGIVSEAQETMIAKLNYRGYKAIVAEGADEAMQATKDYMNIPLSR